MGVCLGCLCPVVFAPGDCDVVECLFQSCRVGNVVVFIKYVGETALGLLSTFTGGIVAGNFPRRVLHEVNQVGWINVRGLVRPVGIKVDVVVGNASADVVNRPPLGIRKDGVDPERPIAEPRSLNSKSLTALAIAFFAWVIVIRLV